MRLARSSTSRKAPAFVGLLLLMPAIGMAGATGTAQAATPSPINLGTTSAASVLGGAGVTNTGPSVLNRDLDSSPTPAMTGFPPGIVNGTKHAADGVAKQAQLDLTTAYNATASAPSTNSVTGLDLSGRTLTQGVYTASSSMALNGPLALTLNGTAASVFVFQAGSTLITGSRSSVVLTGGVLACNVFWQVGSSATLGTNTRFVGNILAQTSITLTTGATVNGRALARTGSVTLDSNVFTGSPCGTTPVPVPTTTASATKPTTLAAGSGGAGPTLSSGSGVPAVVGPPHTGGAPIATTSHTPWSDMWLSMVGVAGAIGLGLAYQARRRSLVASR